MQDGTAAGEQPNLSASLQETGQDPARVVAEANSDRIVASPASATEVAMEAGVFGSPSFAVGSEVFWGDDRLEDAIARAKRAGST